MFNLFRWFIGLFRRQSPQPLLIAAEVLQTHGQSIALLIDKRNVPEIEFYLKDDEDLVAATVGTKIYLGKQYMSRQSTDEIKGAVIHEIVHAIQQAPTYKGEFVWMIEGLADFVRWNLRYGELKAGNPRNGYREGADFFNWLYATRRYYYVRLVKCINTGTIPEDLSVYLHNYTRERG